MRYSALDPGRTTGYADFEDGEPIQMGEFTVAIKDWEALMDWLYVRQINKIDVLVVENYRNRPVAMTQGHANTWSENLESQIIGFCRCYCMEWGIEMILQDASIKPVGYGYAGLKYVKGKAGQHMNDALAHASYWYMNEGSKRRA